MAGSLFLSHYGKNSVCIFQLVSQNNITFHFFTIQEKFFYSFLHAGWVLNFNFDVLSPETAFGLKAFP